MKRQNDDLARLRAWLVEDTGSQAEADQLLPIVDRLRNLPSLTIDTAAREELTHLLIREHRGRKSERTTQRTVVCIDDDEAMINLVSAFLKSRGFEVLGAMTGTDGLALVPKAKPDLVLLDLMLPGMDGWEVYQRMKADEYMRSVPVIVVSAKAQTIDKVLGLSIQKVQDYITKPFSPIELVDSINRVLAAWEQAT
jgi:CheY-like chemotaxis protein